MGQTDTFKEGYQILKTEDGEMSIVVKWQIAIVITVGVAFLDSWVLRDLWLWFAVPLGVRAITLYEAMGLNLLINSFISRVSFAKKEEAPIKIAKTMGNFLLGIPLRWVIGYLIAHFALGVV